MNTITKNSSPADSSRRGAFVTAAAAAVAAGGALTLGGGTTAHAATPSASAGSRSGAYVTMKDGTQIYAKEWGKGPVTFVFSHGWPLSSDAWEDQMMLLAANGYRCIAHDRRGHGRSTQPWDGNDYDTFADDLASIVQAFNVRDGIFVGHSMGGGEVARYLGKHGSARASKAVLVAAVTPLMLQTPANPEGTPISAFDGIRAGLQADRGQFFKDLTTPFFGFNRPGVKDSQGMRNNFERLGMQASLRSVYECVRQFSETDFSDDLKKISIPTLVVHGDDDQIVPIAASANKAVKLLKNGRLSVYKGAGHGIPQMNKDQLNAELLAFAKQA